MKSRYYTFWIKISVVASCLLRFGMAQGQDYMIDLSEIDKVQIKSIVSVQLKAHSKSTFLLPKNKNIQKTSKSAELKALFGERDSLGYGLQVELKGRILVIESLKERRESGHFMYLPEDIDVSVDIPGNNDVQIDGFRGEIEVLTHNGNISMEDVSGPLVVSSTNGLISISFREISAISPSSIVTNNGDMDISLPENSNLDLRMKTPHGEIYTEFDLNDKDVQKGKTKKEIKTSLGKGGVDLKLLSYTGNIKLRKTN